MEATFLFGEMLAPLDASVPINSVLLNVNQAKRARCPDAGVAVMSLSGDSGRITVTLPIWIVGELRREAVSETQHHQSRLRGRVC